MEEPPPEGGEIALAQHALERVSVDKAWHLLRSLSSQVDGKQTELQVRVKLYRCIARQWKVLSYQVAAFIE